MLLHRHRARYRSYRITHLIYKEGMNTLDINHKFMSFVFCANMLLKMKNDPLAHIENITRKTNDYMEERTKSAFSRYPLIFSMLSVFGIVSIIYGFESVISYIPFLSDRPYLMFFIGLFVLLLTGGLYKKIDHTIRG